MSSIKIMELDLSLDNVRDWRASLASGGINIFIGDFKNNALGKEVRQLTFESFNTVDNQGKVR